MRFGLVLFLIFNLFSAAVHAAEKRNQLEELLIWKMSDELKLTSVEEKKFSEILKTLNDEKAQINQSLQKSVEAMNLAPTSKAKDAELSSYKKLLQSYGKLGLNEIERLKPLLGTDRLVKYLALKQDLTNKIKTLLSSEGSNGNGKEKASLPLPSPKIIEEK